MAKANLTDWRIAEMKKVIRSGALLLALLILLMLPGAAHAACKPEKLIPMGVITGIQIETDGVIITDILPDSPAQKAGLRIGDRIVQLDRKPIRSGEELRFICAGMNSGPISVTAMRGSHVLTIQIHPVSSEGWDRLGIAVRDALSGIGTITFVDPRTGIYGALGHGITEGDDSEGVPLRAGWLTKSIVSGVIKGIRGAPGRILGVSDSECVRGSIAVNSPYGIFGLISESFPPEDTEALPIASREEITRGTAWLLSDLSGEGVKTYRVEIERVYPENGSGRDMLLQVSDPELLQISGGIVQGMSGSPLLQNGKIIGALTHVLVNDPTKGYGISIDTMLASAY